MKIAILGYSGSGKSTLAKFLGDKYQIPVLHLDSVQFIENWQERDRKEALALVREMMVQEDWIIDGNYTNFDQEERLEAADRIIFVQFSRWASLKRVITRRIRYHKQARPDMAPGCHEKMDFAFFWWVIYQGRSKERRQKFESLQHRYASKSVMITNQKALDNYYQKVDWDVL